MRKQIDYVFRVLRVSAVDPQASREIFESIVKDYLVAGFDLFHVENIRQDANDFFVQFHFVKYEDEVQEIKTKKS